MTKSGFTFIEVMLVIGLLTILMTVVLVAVNPARQFAQANNTKRVSDVNTIINAIYQYAADNKGALPAGITISVQTIANTAANICANLVPTYIAQLPVDPLTNSGTAITNCGAAYTTNYTVVKDATSSRVTVAAPAAEISQTITVTR